MQNNITPQQNSQEMTAEEAKASLGIATFLQQQLMPKASPEAPQTPQEGIGTPETSKPDNTPDPDFEALKSEMEAEFDSKLEEMEKSTKDTIRAEIGGIKDLISEALKDDNQN